MTREREGEARERKRQEGSIENDIVNQIWCARETQTLVQAYAWMIPDGQRSVSFTVGAHLSAKNWSLVKNNYSLLSKCQVLELMSLSDFCVVLKNCSHISEMRSENVIIRNQNCFIDSSGYFIKTL